MMIDQIVFLVLFIGPILEVVDTSNGYCPAPVNGAPSCNHPPVTTSINFMLAYDSEERRVLVHEAFVAIRRSVHELTRRSQFAINEVWQGQSVNLTLGSGENVTFDKEMPQASTVGQMMHIMYGEMVPLTPVLDFLIAFIVIEFVSDPCPSIADCQNAMNRLCHDHAFYVFHVSLGGSSAATGYEQFSNCICSHLVKTPTPAGQFCVPVTSVAGWLPTPGTIFVNSSQPTSSRASERPTDSSDRGSNTTLIILLSIGLVFMVVACIIAALAYNKVRQMAKDHKLGDAVLTGKVPASPSPAFVPGQVAPKKSGYGRLTDLTPKVQSRADADVQMKKSAHGSIKGSTPNIHGPIGSVVAKSQLKEAKTPGDKKATLNADATKSTSKSVTITHE